MLSRAEVDSGQEVSVKTFLLRRRIVRMIHFEAIRLFNDAEELRKMVLREHVLQSTFAINQEAETMQTVEEASKLFDAISSALKDNKSITITPDSGSVNHEAAGHLSHMLVAYATSARDPLPYTRFNIESGEIRHIGVEDIVVRELIRHFLPDFDLTSGLRRREMSQQFLLGKAVRFTPETE